ncbi:MAG: hypothetical protein J3R72DRAFT_208645 [Linnemannia gamsii]|nr:MAG: hypothetical protein J3R72DRAFT_208645 [Linnemannia gamsii]
MLLACCFYYLLPPAYLFILVDAICNLAVDVQCTEDKKKDLASFSESACNVCVCVCVSVLLYPPYPEKSRSPTPLYFSSCELCLHSTPIDMPLDRQTRTHPSSYWSLAFLSLCTSLSPLLSSYPPPSPSPSPSSIPPSCLLFSSSVLHVPPAPPVFFCFLLSGLPSVHFVCFDRRHE